MNSPLSRSTRARPRLRWKRQDAVVPRAANKPVDLRSDTVTAPSRAMLETALSAPTGDDVMNEDPTVSKLEEHMAGLFGKEKGLYVPTACMANLLATLSHCHARASEIIVGASSHISMWEGGNVAGMGGVHTRQVAECEDTARISAELVRTAHRPGTDVHWAKTEVLCLENTHNMLGGTALPAAYMSAMGALARELDMKLHVDGARIFNASIALDEPVHELCAGVDSVSVCFSKGLGAPLGSVLLGDTEFIDLARRARKRCGGGMRQAGVVAAMAQYAVENNLQRLRDDHRRAAGLGATLAQHGFKLIRGGQVDTNIVFFALPDETKMTLAEFCAQLASEYGVKISGGYGMGRNLIRVVTHMDVNDEDVERAADAMVTLACH